jgi:hypothetical protein
VDFVVVVKAFSATGSCSMIQGKDMSIHFHTDGIRSGLKKIKILLYYLV